VQGAQTPISTVGDGLNCYERGGHVPGCPHRPADGSGIV